VTPPVWVQVPGAYHLPIEGHPSAGTASLVNGRPHEDLTIGIVGGRPLVIEAETLESLEWLEEMESVFHLARARLSMFLPRPAGGAAA
jgi:hypothetical protein